MSAIDYTKLVVLLAFLAGPAGIAWWVMYVSSAIRNLRSVDLSPSNILITPIDRGLAEIVQGWTALQVQFLTLFLSVLVPAIAYIILHIAPPATLDALQETFAFVAMLFALLIYQNWYYQKTKTQVTIVAAKSLPTPLVGWPLADSGPK